MKNWIKYCLQEVLGYQRYLKVFALFKIRTLRWDKSEKDFFFFMSEINASKGLILDVGANIGIMTDHLNQAFPENTILAVEPMPDNLRVLHDLKGERNWKLVEIINKAVGEKEGVVTMILPKQGRTKMQGLSHVKRADLTEWNEGTEVQVLLTTLDELVGNKPVSAIKMDVENYEFDALKGAKNILSSSKPVLYIELWDNANRYNCFDFLANLDYKIYVIVQGNKVKYDSAIHSHQNFLFLPN